MCRFLLYQGPTLRLSSLITEPEHSLIHQSIHANEREQPLNGDGFGVAWYAPELDPRPAPFPAVTPAWNNHNFLPLARVTSPAILLSDRATPSYLDFARSNGTEAVVTRFTDHETYPDAERRARLEPV